MPEKPCQRSIDWSVVLQFFSLCQQNRPIALWTEILKKVEMGKFHITTALKSILKLVKLQSLVAKCCEMRKIWPCKVCEFCILLYYAWKIDTVFSRNLRKIDTKFANFAGLYFSHFTTFRDQTLQFH